MTERFHCLRMLTRQVSIAAICCIVCAAGAAAQSTPAPENPPAKAPSYEVVSIKLNKSGGVVVLATPPDGIRYLNVLLLPLVVRAYGIMNSETQIVGLPGWARSERYDVEARVDADTAEAWKKLSVEERRKQEQPMMQALLADRCRFKAHLETRELPVYDLVIAKGGLKMQEAPAGEPSTEYVQRDSITAHAISTQYLANSFANFFSGLDGRMIIDKTGLGGKSFDFELKWTPEEQHTADDAPDAGPSLFTAFKEQLSLKLVPSKGPVEVLVIDQMERPSQN